MKGEEYEENYRRKWYRGISQKNNKEETYIETMQRMIDIDKSKESAKKEMYEMIKKDKK